MCITQVPVLRDTSNLERGSDLLWSLLRRSHLNCLLNSGFDGSTYQRTWVFESRRWIRHMSLAGETLTALDTAVELLQGHWIHAEEWQIADLHLRGVGLRWKRREFCQSMRSAVRAVRMRPRVLGRPPEAMAAANWTG